MKDLSNDRGAVVITGASRGLGRSMALHLSASGFQVFAGCRQASAAAELRSQTGGRLTPLVLDVADEQSIAAAVETVSEAVGEAGLKGLVNNAGILFVGPVEQATAADVEEQFRVNVFGPIVVTQRFLPLLRRGQGRIVNISSFNGFLSVPFVGIYCASKFAVEAISDALRMELKPWHISVSIVQPGVFATDLRKQSLPRWTAQRAAMSPEAQALYQTRCEQTLRLLTHIEAGAGDPRLVAEAVCEALTSDAPQTRYLVGEDAKQFHGMLQMPDDARDAALLGIFEQAA